MAFDLEQSKASVFDTRWNFGSASTINRERCMRSHRLENTAGDEEVLRCRSARLCLPFFVLAAVCTLVWLSFVCRTVVRRVSSK